MPSPLELLQRRFVRSATSAPDAALLSAVSGGGRLTPAAALNVYGGAYSARLTEALGETYEACWRVLGDDGFFAACADFIKRAPSRSHNLSDYGEGFAVYLEARKDLAHAPYLGDLARLEWTLKEVFHRAPHESLAAKELAAKAGPGSVLRLGGAAELLSLRHRVLGIWLRDRSDDTPLKKKDWTGAQRLLVYKAGTNEVLFKELTASEHGAMTALRAGKPLGDALASVPGLDAKAVQTLFAFLAQSGLIASLR